ncbi:MAG TPA: DUF6259 domain-containing protein [Gaiellaceae bacterium]|nr:DUF6259 domain-containing protein [Gaiellaceae bacterium]
MTARPRLRSFRRLVLAFVAIALVTGVAPAATAALEQFPGITFDDRADGRLVVAAPAYRLTLDKRNGTIVDLVDRTAGTPVASGTKGCLWRAESRGRPALKNACSFTRRGARRFSYEWSPAAATLTLGYRDSALGSVSVALRARAQFFDLRMTVENRGAVLTNVSLPGELFGDVRTVEAGYAPNVLPGVRLEPGYFTRVGNDLHVYPSRWAFADFLAVDAGGGHLSLYAVNSGPIHPVVLGFLRHPPSGRCSGQWFCIIHQFQTWIAPRARWTSPVVRVRIGRTAQQSILAYRSENGIDAYPSARTKLGARLNTLARAPLIKADLVKLKPFRDWAEDLSRLPSPALLHPVAFQPGGHDERDPDFLPPDPRWGTNADFTSVVETAHSLGQLVMPYLNVSWWSDDSPTMTTLPPPLQRRDLAVIDRDGRPVVDAYGPKSGIVVSPFVPFVRNRVARLMQEWRTDVPADCLFFDQVGARQWLRDFNRASPGPLAYYDGWLAVMARYSDRCLMAEDGWDRLARDFTGFHGSMLMMDREHDLPDKIFGEGNWEPYPLATWLLHDKVLFYQHDLYDGTMTHDGEVLTWNMAFGLVSSYSWNDWIDSLRSPWLGLVGDLQRLLGPHYAGVRLTGYRNVERGVTESTFGDLVVLASWDATAAHPIGRYGIAPSGFLARTRDDRILAGAFEGTFDGVRLSEGVHYLILERDESSVTVRQPLGADTEIAIQAPRSWSTGRALRATAIAADGESIGAVRGELRDGRFAFRYAGELNGHPVSAYRISVDG